MISLKPKIIITLAGLGSRFINEGYDIPKYLLPISLNSKKDCIIRHIINEIYKHLTCEIELIIILNIRNFMQVNEFFLNLSLENKNIKIRYVPTLNGQAYSALSAFNFSEPDHGFTIFNGDTLIDLSSLKEEILFNKNAVSTFISNSEDYSYVDINKNGLIEKIIEKKVISQFATTGIYCFRSRNIFAKALADLEKSRIYNTNEIYLSEVIQKLINEKEKFISIKTTMKDFGSPLKYEALKSF